MKPTLKNLSEEECKLISSEMIMNANRRWDSAKILADHNDYAGAIRDHITSMEEMIKGLVMFLDSKGFEFRKVEGMESIIRRSHTIRHFVGFIMFVVNIFGSELKNLILRCKEDPSAMIKLYNEQKEKKESIIKMYFLRKLVLIRDEFLWFAKVEIYRQEGSHVDYDPSIKSPLDISIEDYKEVFKRLDNVKKVGFNILETFNCTDKEIIELIENFKEDFYKEGWYIKIKEAITSTKHGRKNPFDLMQDTFKEI